MEMSALSWRTWQMAYRLRPRQIEELSTHVRSQHIAALSPAGDVLAHRRRARTHDMAFDHCTTRLGSQREYRDSFPFRRAGPAVRSGASVPAEDASAASL